MTDPTTAPPAKKGGFTRVVDGANSLVQRFLPDPLVIGVILIAGVFLWGMLATPSTPNDMITYFGSGMWSLVGFAMQLSIVIVTSQTLAHTPPVARAITKLAGVVRTPMLAALFVALFTAALSFLNWGVGFVAGVILAREISKQVKGTHFPLLAAAAYAGYTTWSGGLSASIPLALNTPDHPLFEQTGTISLADTIFSPINVTLVAALAVVYALVAMWMTPPADRAVGLAATPIEVAPPAEPTASEGRRSLAQVLEHSRVLSVGIGLIGLSWFLISVVQGGIGAINLNLINLLVFSLGMMLFKGVVPYLREAEKAGKAIIPIVVIYPLYAAVASMITESGLGDLITSFFASFATADTLALITFFTAGLINVFVPADGGHLVLQGPIFYELADQFGVSSGLTTVAMSMGANWTNLLQPFWALPLLAIARLGIRDIMGYCFFMLIAGGVVAALVLGILPLVL